MLINDAEGVYSYDNKGGSYMDFSSQIMCSNQGHKNKVVIDAIIKQAEKLPYIVAATCRGGWFVGAKALHGNPFDGHTLNYALGQVKRVAGH